MCIKPSHLLSHDSTIVLQLYSLHLILAGSLKAKNRQKCHDKQGQCYQDEDVSVSVDLIQEVNSVQTPNLLAKAAIY